TPRCRCASARRSSSSLALSMIQVQPAIRVGVLPFSRLQVASCSAMACAMARPAGGTRSTAPSTSDTPSHRLLHGLDLMRHHPFVAHALAQFPESSAFDWGWPTYLGVLCAPAPVVFASHAGLTVGEAGACGSG